MAKEMSDEIEAKKRELSKRFMIEREVFDKVWDVAWRFGHACGLSEVENYFCDMVEIVDVCLDLYDRK